MVCLMASWATHLDDSRRRERSSRGDRKLPTFEPTHRGCRAVIASQRDRHSCSARCSAKIESHGRRRRGGVRLGATRGRENIVELGARPRVENGGGAREDLPHHVGEVGAARGLYLRVARGEGRRRRRQVARLERLELRGVDAERPTRGRRRVVGGRARVALPHVVAVGGPPLVPDPLHLENGRLTLRPLQRHYRLVRRAVTGIVPRHHPARVRLRKTHHQTERPP
mmetsp:Transcript_23743/g.76691  ORF Transcript_23743/g.76691 Transcript_23743/m.76691 type:complete len:226 (+) Transcript_23743:198-875(+)